MLISDLAPGLELGPSTWFEVEQRHIDRFTDATDDRQWIHVDPERADGGTVDSTIAHGFLTLSLMAPFTYDLLPVEGGMAVNYGLERVRFLSPVRAGSRIRATYRIEEVTPLEGGAQLRIAATIRSEDGDAPICTAESLIRFYE